MYDNQTGEVKKYICRADLAEWYGAWHREHFGFGHIETWLAANHDVDADVVTTLVTAALRLDGKAHQAGTWRVKEG